MKVLIIFAIGLFTSFSDGTGQEFNYPMDPAYMPYGGYGSQAGWNSPNSYAAAQPGCNGQHENMGGYPVSSYSSASHPGGYNSPYGSAAGQPGGWNSAYSSYGGNSPYASAAGAASQPGWTSPYGSAAAAQPGWNSPYSYGAQADYQGNSMSPSSPKPNVNRAKNNNRIVYA